MPSSQEYALSISCATGTFLGGWGAGGGRQGRPPQPGAYLLEEEMDTHQKNYWITIYKATDTLCCDCGPHSNLSYKCLYLRALHQRLLDSEETAACEQNRHSGGLDGATLRCRTETVIIRKHIKASSEVSAAEESSPARILPRSSHTSGYPLMPSSEFWMCVSFSILGT